MNESYRRAFAIVVAICILLAVALGNVLFRDHRTAATDENDPVIARGPAKEPDATLQPMTTKDPASEDSSPNPPRYSCRPSAYKQSELKRH